ncbi:ligand-binding sensor domain-containing protein [Shewanella sp. OMA3-2]|uniref:ligand-binding sensor domain-containing protein n=1 Tax=Shewanella sp. OMA3-2 TaxID=2908650 RepID=UPI001F2482C4|nr:two-component regulator propeller domain-containing protein [Shewanella sp. OMA3-2]UJF21935.1 hypothetical protein L0B17_00220 [Shewanella sp. OMA3-2]
MNLRIFSLLITCFVFASLSYASPAMALHKGKYGHISEIKFEHFDSQQGLNQNSITKLFTDRAGMLWIGTQDGLHSYNGVDFQIYLKRSGDPESISDNFITDIIQTPDGALWVATFNSGLNRLDLKTGKFTRFNKLDGLTDSQVSHLAVIGDTLWVGTRSGLFMMSLKTHKITSIGLGNSLEPQITSLSNIDDQFVIVGTDRVGTYAIDTNTINRLDIPNEMQVNRIQASSIFAVWLAIDNQIWRYNLDTHQKELIWQRPNTIGQKNDIKDFIVLDASQIWAIGNGSGLIQLDFDGKEWQSQYHKNEAYKQNSLSENNLYSMMLDPNGTLWLGTSFSGIDKINLSHQYFAHLFDSSTSNPRSANMIRAIYRDHKQRLWIGTDRAGLKYLTEDGKYIYLNEQFSALLNIPAAELNMQVNDIIEDSQQTVWFATSIGVFTLDKQDVLSQIKPHNPALQADINFRSLAIDDKNRVWLASILGLYFISKDNQQMLPYNFGFQKEYSPYKHQMLTLHFSDGYLWIGTIGGLVRLNPEEKELVFVSNEPGNPYSLSDNRVRDFLRTSNGDLWVATHGGIDKLTTDYGIFKFERLDVNNDLTINTVYSLLEDNDQNLWLGTNSGISRYNPTTKKFTAFNIHEGLQAYEFNGAARFKDTNGDMWFGGINGLNYFIPSDIPQQRPPIKLALTSYTIGDTSYPVLDLSHTPKINMPYEKQLISFEISALNFSYSNLSQYSYSLTGFDSVWHDLPTGSKITYTNLPLGIINSWCVMH